MTQNIKNYNEYQDKIRDYLIRNNDFLYGSIIGFKKGYKIVKLTIFIFNSIYKATFILLIFILKDKIFIF